MRGSPGGQHTGASIIRTDIADGLRRNEAKSPNMQKHKKGRQQLKGTDIQQETPTGWAHRWVTGKAPIHRKMAHNAPVQHT